jgi:hypothetical protein
MDKIKQVQDQVRVVKAIAEQIIKVLDDISTHMMRDEVMVNATGNQSARLMEYLGDFANGMDIVEKEDEWMEPIFKAAHEMFPQTP